ncbi:MAG: ribonuclease Z [bacterium]|nr:ribonuclease Z [bacterium]
MKIIFLGTNGWYDTATGNTISILVETTKAYIVFDAGNGLYKLDRFIKNRKPVYLFLSHLHLDHIIGLHTLAKLNLPQGMHIVVPKQLKKELQRFMRRPLTVPFNMLPHCRVTLQSYHKTIKMPFSIKSYRLNHPSPCWGYRLSAEGKVLAYGPDTGLCANLFKLAKKADVYISESSWRPGETHQGWTHLNPELAAGVAKQAQVKRLILTHFDASRYTTLAHRRRAELTAKKIFKNTSASEDNQEMSI